MRFSIDNGVLIDPVSGLSEAKDLLVNDGSIEAVDKPGSFSSLELEKRYDARDCWVTPGLVDIHVHLREPGEEWKETVESGSLAAALGGYSRICCMPNTKPVLDSADSLRQVLELARKAGRALVHPIAAVSIGLLGKEMSPLAELIQTGAVAFSDDGAPVWDPLLMRRALEWLKMEGVSVCCHQEEKALTKKGSMNESTLSYELGLDGIPALSEDLFTSRDIEIARATGGKVHFCHVSTARSVELIRRAKNDGIQITAEATPHHFCLNEEQVRGYNTLAKMNPPLRSEEDRQALIAGIADGTIDAIASDHAPHHIDAKDCEFERAAFGITGLQTNFPLALRELGGSHKIDRLRLVELLSTGPAQCLGLPAGGLKKGAPADISILDPSAEWTLNRTSNASKSENSFFWETELLGRPRTVFVNGSEIVSAKECDEFYARA